MRVSAGDRVFIRYGVRPELTVDLESVMRSSLPGFPSAVREWKREDIAMSRPERVSDIAWRVDEVFPDEGIVSVCVDHDPKGEFSRDEFCVYVDEGDIVAGM